MKSFFKFGLMGMVAGLLAQPVLAAPTTVAVNEDLRAGTQKIEQSQDALVTIEDDTTLSPTERSDKGIAARRDIVLNALALSLDEVASIKANLAKLPQFDDKSREKKLQDKFLLELENFNKYYSDKSEQVKNTPDPTLDAIKTTAQEIIDYRETVYNPTVKSMIDFTLFFYNNEVITAVGIYLDKISADIKRFEKLNLLKPDLFKANLEKVAVLIKSATGLQKQAGEAIFGEIAVETPIDPNVPITESLNKIRSAYATLLQTLNGMRKSLGLK